jgi:hypothetical protein
MYLMPRRAAVNSMDRMRKLIECLNEARRIRDGLRGRECEVRSGLSAELVAALQGAGMSRAEICAGSLPMNGERAVALAALTRDLQRAESEIDGIELRLCRLGHEMNPPQGAEGAGASRQRSQGVIIPFPRSAARRVAARSLAGTASVA